MFTGRACGNLSYTSDEDEPAVTRRRATLSRALGVSSDWVTLRQVHGAVVVGADSPFREPPRADGVATGRKRLPLAVFVADCVPLALIGPARAAAVHVGWRGLAAGVVEAGLDAVGERVRAFIGPSIGPCCYSVGSEVPEAFSRLHPSAPGFVIARDGRLYFDLPAAVKWVLASRSVESSMLGPCTSCGGGFYSHRRNDGARRQALLVFLP